MSEDAQKQIQAIAEKLITIRSVSGNAAGLSEVLEYALSELPGFTVERFERNGIESALVYNTPVRPERFKLLLNCHLDVVPGREEDYTPRYDGDKLYGVGALDMKANLASAIVAFRDVAQESSSPLAIQLVTDEEVGGFDGTKLQVESGVRADFVLATEPTDFDVVYKAKGVFQAKIVARGVTAHGAYPWRGDNAVWKIQTFLEALKANYPVPSEETEKTTVNVGMLNTPNTAFNKIPDECSVGLDIRFAPEDRETIQNSIQSLLPDGCEMIISANEPPLATDEENAHIKSLREISTKVLGKDLVLRGANGTSDARHFEPVGCPGIEFGPVGGGIGSDDEWVSVQSLGQYYRILSELLRAS